MQPINFYNKIFKFLFKKGHSCDTWETENNNINEILMFLKTILVMYSSIQYILSTVVINWASTPCTTLYSDFDQYKISDPILNSRFN